MQVMITVGQFTAGQFTLVPFYVSCTFLGQKVATHPLCPEDTSSYRVNFVAVSWSRRKHPLTQCPLSLLTLQATYVYIPCTVAFHLL